MKIVDVEPIIEKLYKISDEKDEAGEHEFALGIDTVIYLLEQAKTVDAEPVRHGKVDQKFCKRKDEWGWTTNNLLK